MKRLLLAALLVSAFALGAMVLQSTPAAASHWCSPATISYSPVSGYTGDSTQFSYVLDNNIADALTVNHFYVTYSWSATQWDLGGVTIPGYGSYTFYDTQVLPSSSGTDTLTISVDGIAGGDLFSSTCNWSPATFTVLAYTPPSVAATANPTTGTSPLTVTLSATVSNGLGPYTYAWTFGDGSTGYGQTVSHTYQSSGTYTAQVVVTDSRSQAASSSVTVTVNSALGLGGAGADTTTLLILVVVLVAVVLAVVVVVTWRRKRTAGPPPPPPQPPMPPQP